MPPEIKPPIDNGINALCLNDQQLERTSDWSQQNLDSFKMAMRRSTWTTKLDTSIPWYMDLSDIYPPAFNLIVLQSSDEIAYKDLDASQKPFYNRLERLRKWANCPGVNIAYDLLTHTGFEDSPIHFISQPKLKTKISTMTVVSEADYVVIGHFLPLAYMVVIEDTCGNEAFEKRRYQMAGDMMVAATIRHAVLSPHDCYRSSSTRIFGMLVWKSDVSFYQAAFTHEDLTKRQSGCPTFLSSTIVEEDIANLKNGEVKASFSLLEQKERRSIVGILLGIKEEILSMMSDI
jgi:hypothetical protein